MAAENERLRASPGEMARVGAALYEPAELVQKTFSTLRTQREALGRPWGEGDEIAEAAEKDLVPMIEMLDDLGTTLAKAFTHTAENTIESANAFHAAEETSVDQGHQLGSSFDSGGYGTGGDPGGRR